MGATSFYQWPYPDPTATVDVARDIKALAESLELMKNGFTVPSGDVTVGDAAVGTARSLHLKRLIGGTAYDVPLQCGVDAAGTGFAGLATNISGVVRPVPFAMFGSVFTVTLTNEAFKAITITFPVGRFTQMPMVVATSANQASYCAYNNAAAAASAQCGVFYIPNTPVSVTRSGHMMALQTTPTNTAGRSIDEATYPRYAICLTEECENARTPVGCVGEDGDVMCGPCGNPITTFD